MTCVASGSCVERGGLSQETMLMSVFCAAAGGPVNIRGKEIMKPVIL